MANFIKDENYTTGKEFILDTPAQQSQLLQFVPALVKHIINSKEAAANPSNDSNWLIYIY